MRETRIIRGWRVVFAARPPLAQAAKYPDKRICLRQMCRVTRCIDR